MIFTFSLKKMFIILPVLAVLSTFVLFARPASTAQPQKTQGPQRIVSLSPAITESLYLLGMGDSIVGVTIYCNRPKDAQRKEKIGTVIEPDVEKIVNLKPDLVIAMNLTNRKSVRKMKDLGLNVVTFEIPDNFSRLCEVFLEIGRATGRPEESRLLVSRAQARVDRIKKKTQGLAKPRVLVQIGSKPFFVATKDYFINDYIEFSGAINVFKDAMSGSVGREKAIMQNPDVIFVVTMGLSGDNERLTWKRYSSVGAVKKGRIYLIDSDDICSPTPASFARSLEDIAKLLHPDEAKGWK